MITERLYISLLNTTLIYGEINESYRALEKLSKLRGNRLREGIYIFARIHMDALEQRITIKEAKERLIALSKDYPEIFMLDREYTGDVNKSVNGYIHRLEYAINRYDIKYPYYNMQRCDDL
ncbi:MAG: hypothetical protein RXP30_00705 [Thermoplasmata archaeon]|nr:hypothetical protein [Thermoplasmata archaeon]MVT13336.1 hypothetical protein [Euryarchaeota archaeon]MVT14388.1 hypothetical protein [Euryarchaeota archaeon]MVT35322.1 hypothetical protein [Euryarchaeota archaeon]